MRYAKLSLTLLVFGFCLFVGCGDGGNAVYAPTENYQLSEQEQQNADRIAEEMAKQRQ